MILAYYIIGPNVWTLVLALDLNQNLGLVVYYSLRSKTINDAPLSMLKFKVNISHLSHKKLQIKFLYQPPWGNVQWSYVLLPWLPSKWVEYVLLFRNATIPQRKYRLKTIKRVTRQAVKLFFRVNTTLWKYYIHMCLCVFLLFWSFQKKFE